MDTIENTLGHTFRRNVLAKILSKNYFLLDSFFWRRGDDSWVNGGPTPKILLLKHEVDEKKIAETFLQAAVLQDSAGDLRFAVEQWHTNHCHVLTL